MAILRRINSKAKSDENTGFGTNSSMYGDRLVNRDGRANVRKTGIPYFNRLSWYHTMLEMPRWKFLSLIFISFLFVNLVFALIYSAIGVEHLGGMEATTPGEKFIEAYFFSAQTFTTVGYGRINPTGYLMSFVAAFEAFSGLLFFALATGLFYARFSRPQAFLRFTDKAIIAPYKNGTALMFRLAPTKNNHLTDAEVKLTLGMSIEDNGKRVNKFYDLPLELAKVNTINLSWTLVHAIDDKSALYNLSLDDLKSCRVEIIAFVKAFDETYSNTVVARTSYTAEEINFGERYLPMYHRSEDGSVTILDLDKLNLTEKAELAIQINEVEASK